ncbi:MAG: hypothetical protein ACRDRG_01015 [Pseudonocardiaceae bacterium]
MEAVGVVALGVGGVFVEPSGVADAFGQYLVILWNQICQVVGCLLWLTI